MKAKEFIKHEPNDEGAWICLCGNMPAQNGFFPCDENGNEVEALEGSNWKDLYVCAECGRIINQYTLEVLGQNPEFKLLDI